MVTSGYIWLQDVTGIHLFNDLLCQYSIERHKLGRQHSSQAGFPSGDEVIPKSAFHFSHLQPIESFFLPIVCATHSVGHGGVTRISQSSFAREIIDIVIATPRHLIELNIYAFWQNWEVPPCNSAVHACSYEGFQLSFHLFGGL